jgi:hypothetical protein
MARVEEAVQAWRAAFAAKDRDAMRRANVEMMYAYDAADKGVK